MSTSPRTIHIFLSSPSDVEAERKIVEDVVNDLRSIHYIGEHLNLQLHNYNRSTPPIVGDTPQTSVNRYAINPQDCDILICVLWSKMGTRFVDDSTGTTYQSGTLYEFEQAYKANLASKRPVILLYRKTEDVLASQLDNDQYSLVEDFFASFRNGTRKGLYEQRFKDVDEFRYTVYRQVLTVLFKEFNLRGGASEESLRDLILTRFRQANSILLNYPSTIGRGISLKRSEAPQIVEWIYNSGKKERVALLVDKPGTGKTVVMAQTLALLQEKRQTVFSIKADYISGIKTNAELQERYQLPLSIVDCIKLIAIHDPVTVLIDQVDALSMSLSQDFSTLDLMYGLVLILSSISNVHVIISCREFDLNFDPKLTTLRRNEYKMFRLEPLSSEQVDDTLRSLGVNNVASISPGLKRLLTTPLHLAIYVETIMFHDQYSAGEEYYSLQQLYDRLWQEKIVKASHIPNLTETVYVIADWISKNRKLSVPVGLVSSSDYQHAIMYLQHIGFIRLERSSYSFFHQTFFDYCFSRQFISTGRSLQNTIFSGTQGLFERAFMMQVLTYLRYADEVTYVQELEFLLFSNKLRPLLWSLLLEWFASLETLSSAERSIGLRLMQQPAQTWSRFLAAAHGNPAWALTFDKPFLATLLTQDEKRWHVTDYLTSIVIKQSGFVLELILPYVNASEDWNKNILWCLMKLEDWTDTRAVDAFCRIMQQERGLYVIDRVFEKLLQFNPSAGCQALKAFLRLLTANIEQSLESNNLANFDIESSLSVRSKLAAELRLQFDNVLDHYPFRELVMGFADANPHAFIDNVLDWFVQTTLKYVKPNNGDFSFPTDMLFHYDMWRVHSPRITGSRVEHTFLDALIYSLRVIAQTDVTTFRRISATLLQLEADTIHFVLIQGYLANPKEYSSEIFDYVIGDERHLEVGYNDYDVCLLFGAAYRYGTELQRESLEIKIFDMYPEWERRSLADALEVKTIRVSAFRITQKRFLEALPVEFISSKAQKRLQELERKFPGRRLKPFNASIETFSVGSPISNQQIAAATNEDVLQAMQFYDETTEWGASNKRFGHGGIYQLSGVISEETKNNPERFYKLTKVMSGVSYRYFIAVLHGLVAAKSNSEWIFDLASEIATMNLNFEGRQSLCRALEQYAQAGVPSNLIDLMSSWALHDEHPPYPDPHHDDEVRRYNEWRQRGINSVRGVAVEAVCHCLLSKTPPAVEQAFELLFSAADDVSPAVGSCVLHSLPPLLNDTSYRLRALDVAEKTLLHHPQLVADEFTYHGFLSWASFYFFERFGRFVEEMLNHPSDEVRQAGGQLACESAFSNQAAYSMRERAINGDRFMRRGAALTYRKYIKSAYSSQCIQPLLQLAWDEDREVKETVAYAFSRLNLEVDLEEFRDFLVEMIASPAVEINPHPLLDFVLPVAAQEHDLALHVTERMLGIINLQQGGYRSYDEDVVSLPLAVYNRSSDAEIREKALGFFERLLEVNLGGAKKALEDWDNDRVFTIKSKLQV